MIDAGLIFVETMQSGAGRGEFRIELPQIGQGGPRFLDFPELR